MQYVWIVERGEQWEGGNIFAVLDHPPTSAEALGAAEALDDEGEWKELDRFSSWRFWENTIGGDWVKVRRHKVTSRK